jgi:UDP-glucose 4-epimerase
LYGDADVLPTPEDHPARPLSPYGQSKYAAEGYCELYTRTHGTSTVSLRYSNVYGPRQDIHGEGGVVAIFCGCLLEARQPTVFGDGRQTRDWVEVSDVVRANLLAAESSSTGAVNISSAREVSVLELWSVLKELEAGSDITNPRFESPRPGEVRRSCLAPNRARAEFGWEATVELREGVRRILRAL